MTEQAAQQAAALPQPEEGIEPDDLNTTMIVAIALISTALLLASVLGVTALVDTYQAMEVERPLKQAQFGSATSVLTAQENQLNAYSQDTNKPGVYYIPINEAKRLVVEELQAASKSAD